MGSHNFLVTARGSSCKVALIVLGCTGLNGSVPDDGWMSSNLVALLFVPSGPLPWRGFGKRPLRFVVVEEIGLQIPSSNPWERCVGSSLFSGESSGDRHKSALEVD